LAKTNLDTFRELGDEYGDILVEIVAKLQKVQDKVCSVCVSRKVCKDKDETNKLADKILQTKDIQKISTLVGAMATHITREIGANIFAAKFEKEAVEDEGTPIKIE